MSDSASNSVPLSAKKDGNIVFPSEKGQVFRIPALFYDEEHKTLMAFAEKRTSADNSASVALVMSTGKVNADQDPPTVTWSHPKVVVEKKSLKHQNSLYRPMNPCPVYDENSNTLFLFFIGVEGNVSEPTQIWSGINKTRLFYMTIKEAGDVLEEVKDVTDSLPHINNWATFAVGPGHGCQTANRRLIVPAYAYPLCCCFCCHSFLAKMFSCFNCWCCIKCCCPRPHAVSIYSDDGNITLKVAEMLEEESLECQMAELSDGTIYCNARSGGGHRVEGVSHNTGESFSKLRSKLIETGLGCEGTVVSFPAQPEEADSGQEPRWLLYSHPADKKNRKDLGVYLNTFPQDPVAWSEPWIINPGPSGYSDLAYLGGGCFACLMERGEKDYIEQIACKFFSFKDVEQNVKK